MNAPSVAELPAHRVGRLSIARALQNYDVGSELGRGGMGVVLAGHHRQLNRSVAIKELPSLLADDPAVRARFVAEARVLASLDHPHIVPIYDFTESEDRCLLVMENLPGGSVWDHFNEGGFTPATSAAIAMVTCAALTYAHDHGVLHRDIKPENLLFSTSRVLKVTDFGIAKVIGGGDTLATSAGDILGTPAYMAPEQAEGTTLSPATDVYATGVMLYELLTGRLPYPDQGGPLAIIYRHVHEDPIPITAVAPDLPMPLASVTMQALQRDPADRFASAEDFGVAIGEAATRSWGVGWFTTSQIALMSSTRLLTSTERPTAEPPLIITATALPVRNGQPTVAAARPLPAPPPSSDETVGGPNPPLPLPLQAQEVVRPANSKRPRPSISQLDDAELVPISEVLELPRRAVLPGLLALALLITTVVVALVGLGSAQHVQSAPGMLSIGGVDPAVHEAAPIDFTKPIPLELHSTPIGAESATEVRLELSVAGSPPLPTPAAPLSRSGDVLRADVDPGAAQYLAAGTFDTSVVLLANGEPVGDINLTAQRSGSNLLTVPGILTIAAFLFTIAYAEGFLRRLRRRRRAITAMIGMVPVGASAGACAAVLAWLFGGAVLAVPTIIVCASVAALAGWMAAISAARFGRRSRAKRVARSQQHSRPPRI